MPVVVAVEEEALAGAEELSGSATRMNLLLCSIVDQPDNYIQKPLNVHQYSFCLSQQDTQAEEVERADLQRIFFDPHSMYDLLHKRNPNNCPTHVELSQP